MGEALEAADRLFRSEATISSWKRAGLLPVVRIGRKSLIPRLRFERLMRGEIQPPFNVPAGDRA